MKISPWTVVLVSAFQFFNFSAFPQGSLTPPPGPPAPTMKTLDQVEPRKEINATNTPGDGSDAFIISQPGSYYLTGNLSGLGPKNAISIRADNVTLDLNGFALLGAQVFSIRGIIVPAAQTNVRILNGTVRNWPVCIDAANATNSILEGLRVSLSGGTGLSVGANSLVKDCLSSNNTGTGISVGDNSMVANCTVTANQGNNGTAGILLGDRCLVTHCVSSDNAGTNMHGIYSFANFGCTISHCLTAGNSGYGILAADFTSVSGGEAVISDCTALSNAGGGIHARSNSVIKASTARKNTLTGISADQSAITNCSAIENKGSGFDASFSSITDCRASSNGDAVGEAGILASSGSRIEGNNVTGNYTGIRATGPDNVIIRNTALSNAPGGNFSIAAGNANAQVLTPGTNFTNTDPTANISY